MPTPVDDLTIESSKAQRQQAVSACISQLVDEGRDRDAAVAACINMADKRMGTKTPRN